MIYIVDLNQRTNTENGICNTKTPLAGKSTILIGDNCEKGGFLLELAHYINLRFKLDKPATNSKRGNTVDNSGPKKCNQRQWNAFFQPKTYSP